MYTIRVHEPHGSDTGKVPESTLVVNVSHRNGGD